MAQRFTTEQKLAEIKRELSYRSQVYPGIIKTNPARRRDLESRRAILEEIRDDLAAQLSDEKPTLRLEGGSDVPSR